MRPGAVARPPEVDRYEPDEVGERELDVVAAIDRKVRGSARTVDIVAMLAQPGTACFCMRTRPTPSPRTSAS